MATINIANLGDAGVVSDIDYLHISQAGVDYRITVGDLADKFGEVDIFALNEDVDPLNDFWLPVNITVTLRLLVTEK